MIPDKPFSAAAERNHKPIAAVLGQILIGAGLILEIGSGTGQHAAYLAKDFPAYRWLPTDLPEKLDDINEWAAESGAGNILPAAAFDLSGDSWPVEQCDVLICMNTIHIVAWPLVENLFLGARRVLKPGGVMYLYGPFEYSDRPLEPTNAEFNEWLKMRDPKSGIRKLDEVNRLAQANGLVLVGDEPMPANNRSLWWRKG